MTVSSPHHTSELTGKQWSCSPHSRLSASQMQKRTGRTLSTEDGRGDREKERQGGKGRKEGRHQARKYAPPPITHIKAETPPAVPARSLRD